MVRPRRCGNCEWFDGIPRHSLICISTIGGFGNHNDIKDAWIEGYEKTLEVLEPSEILLFGKHFPEIRPYGKMVVVGNDQLKRKATLSARGVGKGTMEILEASDAEQLRINTKTS